MEGSLTTNINILSSPTPVLPPKLLIEETTEPVTPHFNLKQWRRQLWALGHVPPPPFDFHNFILVHFGVNQIAIHVLRSLADADVINSQLFRSVLH